MSILYYFNKLGKEDDNNLINLLQILESTK
jgi:hypothetical protein